MAGPTDHLAGSVTALLGILQWWYRQAGAGRLTDGGAIRLSRNLDPSAPSDAALIHAVPDVARRAPHQDAGYLAARQWDPADPGRYQTPGTHHDTLYGQYNGGMSAMGAWLAFDAVPFNDDLGCCSA